MPQYDSKREETVQAILLPYTQGVAKAVSRPANRDIEYELSIAIPQDPWFQVHRNLLTQRKGLAWYGTKLYVPQIMRDKILKRCHDVKQAGHFGFVKTLHLARHQFWWPTLRRDVEEYVKSCPTCATCKTYPGKPLGHRSATCSSGAACGSLSLPLWLPASSAFAERERDRERQLRFPASISLSLSLSVFVFCVCVCVCVYV
ncbi:hypothetical protein NXF25_019100 [Crotalus adamanteus]|uniref:Gypsy retrotransposon integrase-like protein 1 n=1 Tax=Crotalus adamanteus TaxID=8729 RepID=A0AAW1B1H6_CROAD